MLEKGVFQLQENYGTVVESFLRPELHSVLQQAGTIQRFEGLGLSIESIEGETVKAHTLRLLPRTDELPISKNKKTRVKKTLIIHDLPETIKLIETGKTADTTAVVKALLPDIDEQIEISEKEVAKKIFNDDEFGLYLGFSQASDFLKSRDQNLPTEIGLISKFLDKVDADLKYHKMAINDRGNWKKLRGQSLAFDQYVDFSKKLDFLMGTPLFDTAILCQNLLNETILSIKEMWSEISFDEVPPEIRKCIDNFQIHSLDKEILTRQKEEK